MRSPLEGRTTASQRLSGAAEADSQKRHHSWQGTCRWRALQPPAPVWNWSSEEFSICLMRDSALLQCDTSTRLKAHGSCANHVEKCFLPFLPSLSHPRGGQKSQIVSQEGGGGKKSKFSYQVSHPCCWHLSLEKEAKQTREARNSK